MSLLNGVRILIVDDTMMNIKVLTAILEGEGYQVAFAKDGKSALAMVEEHDFSLILLDVMMPGIDGYEVCAQLKSSKKSNIPVIFISAKDEFAAKKKGFDAGAVDYITKPIDAGEVLLRTRTHLLIAAYATKLEQMVEQRTQQLIHADRLASLGTFSSAIVHEINNPVTAIQSGIWLIEKTLDTINASLQNSPPFPAQDTLKRELANVSAKVKGINDNSKRIAAIIQSIKSYARSGQITKCNETLAAIIKGAVALTAGNPGQARVEIEDATPPQLKIHCNAQKMVQVFVNLFDNACDAMKQQQAGLLRVSAHTDGAFIQVEVTDNGPGMPPDVCEKIFDPFFTTKINSGGTGLGLYVVQTIIEEHNGSISLDSVQGQGTTFKIRIPLAV